MGEHNTLLQHSLLQIQTHLFNLTIDDWWDVKAGNCVHSEFGLNSNFELEWIGFMLCKNKNSYSFMLSVFVTIYSTNAEK